MDKELWEHIQSIPKDRHLHVECKRSMGAMVLGQEPMVLIEGVLHPLDKSPSSETVVLNFSVEDAKVLKRTIERTLAAIETTSN